ncbi:hypothetical protein FOZ63_000356 [Perkinsus olseni]|uniref:Uncharacterized protein n=1 Tax=Perkinsus olseni TaxID=32597 RepID=A0A7J6RWA4_PEROL|nr:hypothetical protein FOZ63_000356 [Perkinsus olseni]
MNSTNHPIQELFDNIDTNQSESAAIPANRPPSQGLTTHSVRGYATSPQHASHHIGNLGDDRQLQDGRDQRVIDTGLRRSSRISGAPVELVSLPPVQPRLRNPARLQGHPTIPYAADLPSQPTTSPTGHVRGEQPQQPRRSGTTGQQLEDFSETLSVANLPVGDLPVKSSKPPTLFKDGATDPFVSANRPAEIYQRRIRCQDSYPYGTLRDSVDARTLQGRPSQFSDWISDSEWIQVKKSSDHLGQAWQKAGHKLFDDTEASPSLSTVLREWEKFCYAEWTSPTSVDAVRAFMSSVISPNISADVKKAFGRDRLSPQSLRSKHFYAELYEFCTGYLSENNSDPIYVTSLLQKILTLKQGNRRLAEHLQEVESLIEELRFCSSSHTVQLDFNHLSNSLQLSLGDPFRGWYFDQVEQMARDGCYGTFESLIEICRELRRRGRVLGPERPYTFVQAQLSKTVSQNAQLATVQMGGDEVSTHTVLDTNSGTATKDQVADKPNDSASRSPADNKKFSARPKTCWRCFQRSHSAQECRCPQPKKIGLRCRCGSGKQVTAACPVRPEQLKCERCGDSSALPIQIPHRSGVCPYAWEDIQKVKNAVVPSPPTSLAHIDGVLSTQLPELEICALATEGVTSRALQPRTPITVGVPHSSSTVSVLALWDTGASGTFVRVDVLEALAAKSGKKFTKPSSSSSTVCATLADNKTKIELLGTCLITLTSPKTTATVRAFVTDRLSYPLVIGVPALLALRANLHFDSNGEVHITTGGSTVPISTSTVSPVKGSLVAANPTCATTPSVGCDLSTKKSDCWSNQALPPSCQFLDVPPSKLSALCRLMRDRQEQSFALLSLTASPLESSSPSDDAPVPLCSYASPSPQPPTSSDVLQRPCDCIELDTCRSGRFVAHFKSDGIEKLGGMGWWMAYQRANRALQGRNHHELRQINEAIDKLLDSGYVGYMHLKFVREPPPKRVLRQLYARNDRIRGTYLESDPYLSENLPAFIAAQYVFRDSSTTPCRIVFDARPVNQCLLAPTVTRWNVTRYLTIMSIMPAVCFTDIKAAFNQVVWTSRTASTCASILQKSPTVEDPRPLPILIIWASMAFGLSPSPGCLELSTGTIALEGRALNDMISIPMEYLYEQYHDGVPKIYHDSEFDYARPIIDSAFDTRPVIVSDASVDRRIHLVQELCWEDYVDDWEFPGDHVWQALRSREVMMSTASFRGFGFSEVKEFWSWAPKSGSAALGYRYTTNDHLLPAFSGCRLPEDGHVSKRRVSQCLSSFYDPLGRFLEVGMAARLLWRKVVMAINEKTPSGVSCQDTYRAAVPLPLIKDINEWVNHVGKIAPVPRFVPVQLGSLAEVNSSPGEGLLLIVSCDASGVGWSIEVRSRVRALPIGPRLKARGGLFPVGKSADDGVVSTTPRKELHGLLQGAQELTYLCNVARLDTHSRVSAVLLTDSLINLQRLQWLGARAEAEAYQYIGKRGRHLLSRFDVQRLVRVRDLLLRLPVPTSVVHIPSEVNPADASSRCSLNPVSRMLLKLLEQILDNVDQRPSYVPTPITTTISLSTVSLLEQRDDWNNIDHIGYHPWPLFESEQAVDPEISLNAVSPRAGPLPVPLPETGEDQLPVLSDEDREQLDGLIQSSIEEDPVFGKVQCFLRDGTVTSPYTYERLRRAASEYVLEEDGYLYRAVLQRPDGILIRQRVIGRSMRQLAYKLVADMHIKCTHLGAKQLLEKVKEKYHFRNQPKIVRRCLRLCRACLKANAVRRFNSGIGC